MSLLHPRRIAQADRSQLRSYDQASRTALGRRQPGVLGQGADRPRTAVCGDMRKRPAAQTARAAAAPAGHRREVTIATVRATEPPASLEENLALLAAALIRLAELVGPRRCLTADGEVYR